MSKSDSEPSQQYSEAEEQEQPLNSEKVKKDIIHAIQKPIVENNIQEKSITALKDKKIDEAIYKKKKRKTAPKDDKLDEDQLEKLAIASIDAVQEQLNKLQKEERENAIAMKLKYPRRFCIVHLDLYDEEEEYIKHMIRNHKLLAKKENLIKFQCNECGDVYATVGKLNLHDCKGFQQYIKETNKLTPKQKKLAKLSTQLNYQQ